RIRSGAPRTAQEATEPPMTPTSNPSDCAMRAEMGSKREVAVTHSEPARIRRSDREETEGGMASYPGVVGLAGFRQLLTTKVLPPSRRLRARCQRSRR